MGPNPQIHQLSMLQKSGFSLVFSEARLAHSQYFKKTHY